MIGQIRKPEEITLLQFWQIQAITKPLLSIVAIAAISIAPSEAAVERSFSHQKLVHNPLRNSLSEESVQALMRIRFNLKLVIEELD